MKAKILKRLWAEINDINADFFNLRTLITPDTANDDATHFHFMMLPNDGYMAHLTLVGNLYIPEEYPDSPPIVQLYTPTKRFNIDAYSWAIDEEKPHTTICFDLFHPQSKGGTWKSEYTLSSLFGSLMSAIVSLEIRQINGAWSTTEFVSMEVLDSVRQEAKRIYEQHRNYLPNVPKIPLVEATMVPAKPLFAPQKIYVGPAEVLKSKAIYLQTGSDEVYSFAVDLSRLHAATVFSVVLSNSDDLKGKNPNTILVRNGVTATAARKLANKKTVWFYHGKPMNDGNMRLHVTIGRDQMTFADHGNDGSRLYIHGDYPVSWLTADHIGDVKGIPFYVHIYTYDNLPKAQRSRTVKIKVLNIENKGYIYKPLGEGEDNDFGFEVIQRSEAIHTPESV